MPLAVSPDVQDMHSRRDALCPGPSLTWSSAAPRATGPGKIILFWNDQFVPDRSDRSVSIRSSWTDRIAGGISRRPTHALCPLPWPLPRVVVGGAPRHWSWSWKDHLVLDRSDRSGSIGSLAVSPGVQQMHSRFEALLPWSLSSSSRKARSEWPTCPDPWKALPDPNGWIHCTASGGISRRPRHALSLSGPLLWSPLELLQEGAFGMVHLP